MKTEYEFRVVVISYKSKLLTKKATVQLSDCQAYNQGLTLSRLYPRSAGERRLVKQITRLVVLFVHSSTMYADDAPIRSTI